MPQVVVFCSSSANLSPIFFSETERLARSLAKEGWAIIFGGNSLGLMGHLADQALAAGGEVVGIIPQGDITKGIDHKGLSRTQVVSGIWERKSEMIRQADAFVALPGGIGTLDEVSEVMALRQTGEVKKPLVLVDVLDFWKPFVETLTLQQSQGMISQALDELFTVLDTSQDVVEYLKQHLLK